MNKELFKLGDLIAYLESLEDKTKQVLFLYKGGKIKSPHVVDNTFSSGAIDENSIGRYYGNYDLLYDIDTSSCFRSWRGDFNELSICPTDENVKVTVEELLEQARFVNGKYLYGYKGGDHMMTLQSNLYISEFSIGDNYQITGTKETNNEVFLIVKRPVFVWE